MRVLHPLLAGEPGQEALGQGMVEEEMAQVQAAMAAP